MPVIGSEASRPITGIAYSVGASGHLDGAYAGAYSFDPKRDASFWKCLHPGTAEALLNLPTEPDTPWPTRDVVEMCPTARHASNMWFFANTVSVAVGFTWSHISGDSTEARIFDLSSLKYLPPGTWKKPTGVAGGVGTGAVDPRTGDYYYGTQTQLWKYRYAEKDTVLLSNNATVLGGFFPGVECTAIVDPELDALVILTTQKPSWNRVDFGFGRYDLVTGKYTPMTILDSPALTAFKALNSGHASLVYDSDLKCYYSHFGAGSYKNTAGEITPDTSNRIFKTERVSPDVYRMTELPVTGVSLPAGPKARSLPSDNYCGRVFYCAPLRSLVFVPSYDSDAYAVKTSQA
jgi:hypothetical protein